MRSVCGRFLRLLIRRIVIITEDVIGRSAIRAISLMRIQCRNFDCRKASFGLCVSRPSLSWRRSASCSFSASSDALDCSPPIELLRRDSLFDVGFCHVGPDCVSKPLGAHLVLRPQSYMLSPVWM
jgi:hypothetical protein